MRVFVLMLIAWMALELSGARAVFAGECNAICLDEEQHEDESCADEACAPCACCAWPRVDAALATIELPAPVARELEISDQIARIPNPDPREILHIPIA